MPCYSPRSAWRLPGEVLFYEVPDAQSIRLNCGQCIGCRLDRSAEWATRLMDELRFHGEASFITLTYSPEFLPPGGMLRLDDFQRFLKRLRKAVSPRKLRFFHAGEYGEKLGRPHYHAIIFGEDFYKDRFDLVESPRGDLTWQSPLLNRCWSEQVSPGVFEQIGRARIGEVTFESCAYVARYITKKVNGKNAEWHYLKIDWETGEVHDLKPEYATMSRNPGIGKLHAEKYLDEIYARDSVFVYRGKGVFQRKPPRFYDSVLARLDPVRYLRIKDDRESALHSSRDRSPARLRVREAVKRAQLGTFLSRSYEIG